MKLSLNTLCCAIIVQAQGQVVEQAGYFPNFVTGKTQELTCFIIFSKLCNMRGE